MFSANTNAGRKGQRGHRMKWRPMGSVSPSSSLPLRTKAPRDCGNYTELNWRICRIIAYLITQNWKWMRDVGRKAAQRAVSAACTCTDSLMMCTLNGSDAGNQKTSSSSLEYEHHRGGRGIGRLDWYSRRQRGRACDVKSHRRQQSDALLSRRHRASLKKTREEDAAEGIICIGRRIYLQRHAELTAGLPVRMLKGFGV